MVVYGARACVQQRTRCGAKKMHCKFKSKFSLQEMPFKKMLYIPKNQEHFKIKVEKKNWNTHIDFLTGIPHISH